MARKPRISKQKAQEEIDQRRDEFLAAWYPDSDRSVAWRLYWAWERFHRDFLLLAPETGQRRQRIAASMASISWVMLELSKEAGDFEDAPYPVWRTIVQAVNRAGHALAEDLPGFFCILTELSRVIAGPKDRLPSLEDTKCVVNILSYPPKLLAAIEGAGWFRAEGTFLGFRRDGSKIHVPDLGAVSWRGKQASDVFDCVLISQPFQLWILPEITALLIAVALADDGGWERMGDERTWRMRRGNASAYMDNPGDHSVETKLGTRDERVLALQLQLTALYEAQAHMRQRFGHMPGYDKVVNTKIEIPSLMRVAGKIGPGQSCTIGVQLEISRILERALSSVRYSLEVPEKGVRPLERFVNIGLVAPLKPPGAYTEHDTLTLNIQLTEAVSELMRTGLVWARGEVWGRHVRRGIYDFVVNLYLDQLMALGYDSVSIGELDADLGISWLYRTNESKRLTRIENALHRRVKEGLMGGRDGELEASFVEDDSLSGMDARRAKRVNLIPPDRAQRAVGPRIELPAVKGECCPHCGKEIRLKVDGRCGLCGKKFAGV